ncbi:NAD(P)H-dependent oxidoreductase [Thalassomonas sp. RHCl1]|uniref:NAD(P)H-dependent oxidoreductase n=1 Tax=Thalassomonas sp. RHCl1 TaxID=2995320 RepID=UPI00248C0A7E|nr:NAD(P)H-dependent oxidoreductase [Thalassomonas sp. RHCl1]
MVSLLLQVNTGFTGIFCQWLSTNSHQETSPLGLLTNKQAVIISSAGMDFQQEHTIAMDFQPPYLNIGIKNVSFVPVQGVAMGEESAANAKNSARDKIDSLVAGKFNLSA